jgi:hypothetical protein
MNVDTQIKQMKTNARAQAHHTALLLGLDLFMGVVAVICGAILASGQAGTVLQMEDDVLQGTPFHSFVIPGILLGLAVGGSYLLAAVGLLRGARWGVVASAVAGAIMLGWIVGEVALLGWIAPRFLQPFIAAYALVTFVEALRQGAWSDLAR